MERGTWVAQLVKCQVMTSQLVSSSPTLGSALTAQSLEPAFRFCVSLSPCPSPTGTLCLSLSKINKY